MNVSRTRPKPKKTESTIPSALSYLTRLLRTMLITTSVPTQPAIAAPTMSASGALLPVSR